MAFPSGFTSVLRSNFVPSQVEIGSIRSTLEYPTSELHTLDDELLELQKQLDAMMVARDDLSRNIEEHYNLLTPFRCLPDDILSEIFIHCLPTFHDATMDCKEAPLVLGCICKRWRSIAYNMPRLWATLHVEIPMAPFFRGPVDADEMKELNTAFDENVRKHQKAIISWLTCSKSCPISITIWEHSASQMFNRPTKSYLEVIHVFSNRIHRLEIIINGEDASDYLAALPSTSFPILRILLVDFDRQLHNRLYTKWKDSGLLSARNLTCLSITFPRTLPEFNANWSNLTHIVAKRLNRRDVLTLFARCPRLVYFDVDISTSPVAITYTEFSLPYLHTLSINSSSKQIGDLFQYADLPSLRNLSYYSKLPPDHTWRSPLLIILSRTNMKLERLTTDIRFFTLSDLIECFTLTPVLTHFSNKDIAEASYPTYSNYRHPLDSQGLPISQRMVSALLNILTPSRNRPVYLRNLKVFEFHIPASSMPVYDHEILNFIRGRMESASSHDPEVHVTPLTEVFFAGFALSDPGEMQIDLQEELSDYIAHGLQFRVYYMGNSPITKGYRTKPEFRLRGDNIPYPWDWPISRIEDAEYLYNL